MPVIQAEKGHGEVGYGACKNREGQTGDPVCIEHRGKVVRQLVLMPDGKVEEETIG
jgi:hypothetical protein